MVYLAAGISSLTGIVGLFFVKERLGLSAEFLAGLSFWIGLPWVLKMPVGHVIDLLWRWKYLFVIAGAVLISGAFLIMQGLISRHPWMGRLMSMEAWYVLAALLAPLGFMIQDVVADAMTVEAVPLVDDQGVPHVPGLIKSMHTTMQTLGRAALVGGGILVSLVNIMMFQGVEAMTAGEKMSIYLYVYKMAQIIPTVSILGVLLALCLQMVRKKQLLRLGFSPTAITEMLHSRSEQPAPNWWIIGGGLIFVMFSLAMGLNSVPYDQEIVFAGSLGIVLFLMARLLRELSPADRRNLIGTAVILFIFRALPGPGVAATWWQIDELGFDQQFLSGLSLISNVFALLGMFIFRRFMAERSIAQVVFFLTMAGTLLTLPVIGLYYGLHHWTAALTSGYVDARCIALVDTALESPLGQVAMIPMLAWIARSAPPRFKATFFAVMASFTNLALSLASLGTKYLNQVFVISREVTDAVGAVTVPADYSRLGLLLITVTAIGLILPLITIRLVQTTRIRSMD